MSSILLLDTTIFLNVLDIPGRNQERAKVFKELEIHIKKRDSLLLPFVTILETGNHISRLGNGGLRRKYAQVFIKQIEAAFSGTSPWIPTRIPDKQQFQQWLPDFPDCVKQNKNPGKTNEGPSLSDFSIIKEWESIKKRHSMSRVYIWSFDGDLAGCDTGELR